MQIRNVLSGGTGEAPKAPAALQAKKTAAATADPAPAPTPGALREILARYDVTDISPERFSEMLGKLHRAGAISDKEFSELSGVRLELDRAGVPPDKEIDLVRFYTERLRRAERADSAASPAAQDTVLRRRTEWLQKAALVQSGGGIDTAA